MDSLFSLLKDKDFDEPPEIAAIKLYVREAYQSEVGVTLRTNDILVTVPSAALASRLRYDTQNLRKAVGTDKRISFRIGR